MNESSSALNHYANICSQSLFNDTSVEYIKNPLSFVRICGNFSLIQTNIMMGLLYQIQQRINESLSSPNGQMMLFQPDEMMGDFVEVRFPLKSIGVDHQHYNELDAALEHLHSMQITYEVDQGNGTSYKVRSSLIGRSIIPVNYQNSFGKPFLYKAGKRRTGDISICICKECAQSIFSLRQGYTEHIRNIVSLCKKARTPRLYMYLSSWRNKGVCVARMKDLREYFGILVYNRQGTKILMNRYPEFANFRRYILDPIQEEMHSLAERNMIDFYFTYSSIYVGEKRRGDPESIMFMLHTTQKGIDYDANRRREQLHALLIDSFQILPEEWERVSGVISDDRLDSATKMIHKIVREQQKCGTSVTHTSVINKILKSLGCQPDSELIQKNSPAMPSPQPSSKDQGLWQLFCQTVNSSLDEVDPSFYRIFIPPCSLYENNPDRLVIEVPSTFVKEKWDEKYSIIGPALCKVFGSKPMQYRIKSIL